MVLQTVSGNEGESAVWSDLDAKTEDTRSRSPTSVGKKGYCYEPHSGSQCIQQVWSETCKKCLLPGGRTCKSTVVLIVASATLWCWRMLTSGSLDEM